MTHYPPIPNKPGKRGRPSAEEMKERETYWKANGGVPQASQSEPNPNTAKRAAVVLPSNSVPTDIQKLIKECPVALSKEEKTNISSILEKLPEPAKGRPSGEYLEKKLLVQTEIKSIIANKINKEQIENNIITTITGSIIDCKQFKDGDRVKFAHLNKDMFIVNKKGQKKRQKRTMGIITRHDVGEKFCFVHWNGGTKEWVMAKLLTPFGATKQEIEEIIDEGDKDED